MPHACLSTARLRVFLAAALGFALIAAGPAAASAPEEKTDYRNVCDSTAPGHAACHSLVVTNSDAEPQATPGPKGYGPGDLQEAYDLDVSGGLGRTVAVVAQYDAPYAREDLAVYRSKYGLPQMADCDLRRGRYVSKTQHSPCFAKVNERGGKQLPPPNLQWAGEITLDIQVVSAVCPRCNILLVEAFPGSSGRKPSLIEANSYAAEHADAVSNSWGYPAEWAGQLAYEPAFAAAEVPIVFSSGNHSYWPVYPAASAHVVAAGGTSLWSTAPRVETAWRGASSFCSSYIPKPSWQEGISTGCDRRATADVSAVADPTTGVAVHWREHPSCNEIQRMLRDGCWFAFGGTSVAAPIVAGVFGLAGNSGRGSGIGPAHLYARGESLSDVVAGGNAISTCDARASESIEGFAECARDVSEGKERICGNPLCVAGPGWDGPTGLGTPRGTEAF